MAIWACSNTWRENRQYQRRFRASWTRQFDWELHPVSLDAVATCLQASASAGLASLTGEKLEKKIVHFLL